MNKDTSSYDYLESFFIKDNMYRWQNEWRIVLHRDQPIIGNTTESRNTIFGFLSPIKRSVVKIYLLSL